MAGSDPRFDATQFRDGIRFAMQMGAPNSVADRATFRWLEKRTYAVHDPVGQTYDWRQAPTAQEVIPDLQVTCTVEDKPADQAGTPAGAFQASRATVTLLDTEYDQLVTHGGRLPDQVIVSGTTYNVDYEGDVQGLFDVDMHQLHCTAADQRA